MDLVNSSWSWARAVVERGWRGLSQADGFVERTLFFERVLLPEVEDVIFRSLRGTRNTPVAPNAFVVRLDQTTYDDHEFVLALYSEELLTAFDRLTQRTPPIRFADAPTVAFVADPALEPGQVRVEAKATRQFPVSGARVRVPATPAADQPEPEPAPSDPSPGPPAHDGRVRTVTQSDAVRRPLRVRWLDAAGAPREIEVPAPSGGEEIVIGRNAVVPAFRQSGSLRAGRCQARLGYDDDGWYVADGGGDAAPARNPSSVDGTALKAGERRRLAVGSVVLLPDRVSGEVTVLAC